FNFTNIVTAYVRVPHPKTYYDDGSDAPWGSNRGQELVQDALDVLIAAGFDFTPLSLDSSNIIRSLNIFYAGTVTSGWNRGLWPHKWDIPTKTVDAANGIKAEVYQMSDLTSSPDIGTFSHENGHLTCGFPDLYNYDNNASVVGDFSLMSGGSHGGGGKHPTSVDPYLKNSAGWATMTDLAPTDHFRVSAQRDRNHYYRIVNPAEPREYIVFETRDDTGYEGPYGGHATSVCPGQGIVAWHVFEGGSNTHPWVTKGGAPVYEALILEASPTTAYSPWYTDPSPDALSSDTFHASRGADPLDDASTPSLKFWDQALHTRSVPSGFTIHSPSISGPTMTYIVGPGAVTAPPRIGLTSVGIVAACDLGSDAADQVFAVVNAGGGTLTYSISDDAAWLSCSPSSGTATAEADEIVASFSTSALATGTHSATITVVAAGASNTPQTIPVTLTVRAAPIVSVSDLSISCPTEDSFFVGNAGGGTMGYTVTDDGTWLSLSRASGTVSLEQDEIVLTCDATGLTPLTTYHAAITVTAADAANSPIVIPVSFLVPIANPGSFAAAAFGGSRIDLSWRLDVDPGEAMVAWSTTPVFGTPVGTYSAGDPIAGGGTVLYRGGGTTVSHTGLMPGTTYYYTAWSVVAGPVFSAGVAVSESTGVSVPYTQDFENGGMGPGGWTQEQVVGSVAWTFRAGGEDGNPAAAHGGGYNAHLYDAGYSNNTTRLVTPAIDFGTAIENAQLTFWHCMEDWEGDQDELRVLYRTSAGGAWTVLATYTASVPSWTQRTLVLPEPGGSYYVAFEGKVNFGYGVCIDDVQITGDEPGAPRGFSATPVSSSRIDLSWSLNPDSDDVLVAWSSTPVFGTPTGAYSVGDTISGGGTVLYGGTGTSAPHTTGLVAGITYYYRAWSRFPDASYSAGVACSAATASAIPYTEDFENGGAIPDGWTQEQVAGPVGWTFQAGGEEDSPAAAHGGSYNARLFDGDYLDNTTRLITPAIDFGTAVENAQLTFWHCMEGWFGDQDELRVLYRTSPGGSWTLLASYTASVPSWTQRTLALPDPGGTYYIAFEGKVNYGYGVCIDDVRITGDEPGTTPGTFVATPAGTSRIDLFWHLNRDSEDVLVAWSTTPVFGTPAGTYSVGEAISGGGTVLYRGGATAASHTGLVPGTPYYYRAWSLLPGAAFSAGVACSASTDPSLAVPFTEGFENSELIPTGWTQQQTIGTADWTFRAGGTFGHPVGAHGGSYNARLSSNSLDSHTARLISPMIDFGVAVQDTQLTFWH
ncbi:MAG: M6 family metalloprotease domain-containing protein, partial [Victivallales bacterium]|nr:M6 family metalloprotease domain-containing protein [Victivallales bacterium]